MQIKVIIVKKTAVVTGANGGIGFHCALQLAKSGADVILACRDQRRGSDAILRILEYLPDAKLELSILDLSSLESVQKFAERLLESKSCLDLLVNNAAIMALPQRMLSKDGFEMQFATNHLGHFALTSLLMPLLLESPAPRVVTVSSIAHRYGKLNFGDLQSEKGYEGWKAYGTSKLANLLFSFELARRASAAGLPLLSLAAHPGLSKTNILASGPQMGRKALRTYLSEMLVPILAQTDQQGALPIVYACTNETVQNGDYYGPDGFMELTGAPRKVAARANALDLKSAEQLWAASEELSGTRIKLGGK